MAVLRVSAPFHQDFYTNQCSELWGVGVNYPIDEGPRDRVQL